MVKSMTGYGRSIKQLDDTTITVEIRTVNHRFLDMSAKMPRSLLYLEDSIKKIIQKDFQRGRVDVYVTLEGSGLTTRTLNVDWDLMDQFITQIKTAQERYQLQGEVSFQNLTEMNDLFTVQEQEEHEDQVKIAILEAVKESTEQVREMRLQEGHALREDMDNRLSVIKSTVENLESRRDIVIEETRERIKSRIEEYTQEELRDQDSRIIHEVGLLAEKGDIAEEITRMFSHVNQFRQTLHDKGAIGRKLDFIVQEMNRESNTVGSKSTDAKISEWVVLLKSEIEKIKEQVQNVE
ncbi:YicC/YloC family endoribonuclease [Pontibacillus sp. HMF3514]|uniref:YicC/YloC family endoribonuclease n=1 Tax=Pontibacillus sp. HMF3514 TaxID=2692425 RepID=UPI00131F890C|nr:YicC/YloC family endoribonuclease [Pontibacillus sp. HMF3514]QHE52136.1 YicC family protein [Pontibacillus sp. HMF3514]